MTATDSRAAVDPSADESELRVGQRTPSRRRRSLFAWLLRPSAETLAAILLAIAALATAWSSYQASVWGGIQSAQYNTSGGLRTRATRAAEQATRLQLLDVFLFTKWLEAEADGHTRLARYYREHFRPEFRPAFEAWRAAGADAAARTTPFERPEYQLATAIESERLDKAASTAVAAGQRANDVSDGYVFDTVILASVLFFAGAVRPLVSQRARGAILFIAFVFCGWSLLRLANEPVAKLDEGAQPLLRAASGRR
jgi:hypothetical protein